MPPLKVSYQDPAQLRRRDRNPRTHTPRQIKQIAASIKEFGFVNPVLIDGSNGIIAGHGRVEAAERARHRRTIPTVLRWPPDAGPGPGVCDCRQQAGRARRLGSVSCSAVELRELSVQPDFDVAITGFETAEIDILIGDLSEEAPDEADVVPDIDRTRPQSESYKWLPGGAKAQLVFTDPPYNVAIAGNASGLGPRAGVANRRDGARRSERRPTSPDFLTTAFDRSLCADTAADGAIALRLHRIGGSCATMLEAAGVSSLQRSL